MLNRRSLLMLALTTVTPLALLVSVRTAAAQTSAPIESLPTEDALKALAGHRGPLVLHATSHDRNCSFCVNSNPVIDAIAERYRAKVRFVRVSWAPWQEMPKDIRALLGEGAFVAVPMTFGFVNGKQVWKVAGYGGPATVKAITTNIESMIATSQTVPQDSK